MKQLNGLEGHGGNKLKKGIEAWKQEAEEAIAPGNTCTQTNLRSVTKMDSDSV